MIDLSQGGDDMVFARVNEHTIRCALNENEVIQMGYDIKELFQNQEQANKFMKEIIARASEAGYPITDEYQEIQSMFLPNHQIILNITEVKPESQIDQFLQNFLNISDVVETIGRERLEQIMDMTGEEKTQAFEQCMEDMKKIGEASMEEGETSLDFEDMMSPSIQEKSEKTKEELQDSSQDQEDDLKKLILWFQTLEEAERFSQDSPLVVPAILYKVHQKYCMVVNVEGIDANQVTGFVFQALEYTTKVEEDKNFSACLQEHAEIIVKEDAIQILKNL